MALHFIKCLLTTFQADSVNPGEGGLPYTWDSAPWEAIKTDTSAIYLTDMSVALAGVGPHWGALKYKKIPGTWMELKISGQVQYVINNSLESSNSNCSALDIIVYYDMSPSHEHGFNGIVVSINNKGVVSIASTSIASTNAARKISNKITKDHALVESECFQFQVSMTLSTVKVIYTITRCTDALNDPDEIGKTVNVTEDFGWMGFKTFDGLQISKADPGVDIVLENLNVESSSMVWRVNIGLLAAFITVESIFMSNLRYYSL